MKRQKATRLVGNCSSEIRSVIRTRECGKPEILEKIAMMKSFGLKIIQGR